MQNLDSLVSICMATYNGEKYLKEQLDSLLNQTYKNIDIIIQDDCSTDTTMEILNSYKTFSNIKVFQNTKNLGYVKNFETVLQKSTGDFIAICDQDDIWETDKIEILLNEIEDSSLIYSNSMLVDSQGNSLNKTLSQKLKNNFINSHTALNFLYDNSVSAHAVLFQKELLKYIIPFSKNIYFDTWIAATASSYSSIKYIDIPLVKYRQHETNTLANTPKKNKNIKKEVLNKVQKKSKEVEDILEKIEELMNLKTLHITELDTLKTLKKYYLEFNDSWFNIAMFRFLLKNSDTLFAITKKNKLKLSLKKSIGKKLYVLVPFL